MREPWPIPDPYLTYALPVSDIHTLYVEECGDPEGPPIVFLHGGPGGGIDPKHRGFFAPGWRAILFDQRGCGKSTPHAELNHNTTWDLIADLEYLRAKLGIEQWNIFGGSWGSTLALAYAVTHPTRVAGLLLRGIFLCRPEEIRWFYQEGASWLFPDYWERFLEPIPVNEQHDLVKAYHKRLTHADGNIRVEAAKAWSQWEAATSRLTIDTAGIERFDQPDLALALARIECHYFTHNCWFPTTNYLLEQVGKIAEIPGVIVQGRYDSVCPAKSAWELHRAWPRSELSIVPDAGHSVFEAGITHALLEAGDRFLAAAPR